ncbi:MAG: polysaccharide export protein [Aestuariivirga sp.]|nr:polysaccharide export protein [Aestuariivirga sp.]
MNNAAAVVPAADSQDNLSYALVDISRDVVEASVEWSETSLAGSFGTGAKPSTEIRLGVGDVVQVTVFESQSGGLFVPVDAGSRPGNYVTFPPQSVDHEGKISVPYAGTIKVAGRPVASIQRDIEGRLKNRAIEPQAVVSIVSKVATEVSVIGDVNSSSKLPVNAAGDRLLDVISKAGGIKYPGYETEVTLQRRGRKVTVPFDLLVKSPNENIYVAPGDVVYVSRNQATFLAYGASGRNGKFDFAAEKLTLAEAVSRAEGLLDDRADPRSVFLYRLEDRRALESYGVDLSQFPAHAKRIPTIYRANFRAASGFFLVQNFRMKNKDVVYISNSDATELFKFLDLIRSVPDTANAFVTPYANITY